MEEQNKEFTHLNKRLILSAWEMASKEVNSKDIIYQHSCLCQTFFPHSNPGQGEESRLWQHKQGDISLAVSAVPFQNPTTRKYEFLGVPYGPKARLLLAFLNTQAVKKQEKILDVGESMTAFIKSLGLNTDGRTIKATKEQIQRIATANISLGYVEDQRVRQVDFKIVRSFDFWFPKDERQRVMWDSSIELTDDYFESLMNRAIPLDVRALKALSHNAMALDIYAWLAQRLHRIDPKKPQFLSWVNLWEQHGSQYGEIRKFRQVYKKTLDMVKSQYKDAKFQVEGRKGIIFHNSPTPIPKTQIIVPDTIKKLTQK